jgi:hypothetical protein
MCLDLPPEGIARCIALHDGAELRRRIETLKQGIPDDAIPVDERPGRYEFFVRVRATRGAWVQFEELQDRGERVIRVAVIIEYESFGRGAGAL